MQELKDKNLTGKKMAEVKKSGFIKVKCHECGSEQTIFGKAAIEVKCNKCSEIIAIPRGGKAAIKAEILEIL